MITKTILLVEDDESVTDAVITVVNAELPEIKIITARDIFEAKKQLELGVPQLILLNTMFDNTYNGSDLLVELKKEGSSFKNIPVIIFSADTSPVTKKECIAKGASGFVSKPFEIQELIDTINKYAV